MMDLHPIQGGVEILQLLHATETGISSGGIGHLAQCRFYPTYHLLIEKRLCCEKNSVTVPHNMLSHTVLTANHELLWTDWHKFVLEF